MIRKMYFLALAADYDGTIAQNSIVDDATVTALLAADWCW
jgi:hypothetical protein